MPTVIFSCLHEFPVGFAFILDALQEDTVAKHSKLHEKSIDLVGSDSGYADSNLETPRWAQAELVHVSKFDASIIASFVSLPAPVRFESAPFRSDP